MVKRVEQELKTAARELISAANSPPTTRPLIPVGSRALTKVGKADHEPTHIPPCQKIVSGCILLLPYHPPGDSQYDQKIKNNNDPVKKLQSLHKLIPPS
jgi:hypothetical protein